MNVSFICAVNNPELLKRCLLASPEIPSADLRLQRGFSSAALAYNAGLEKAANDIVVLAHQDMYFPSGWLSDLARSVVHLSTMDPNWGVLGCWGVTAKRQNAGYMFCTGNERVLGQPSAAPVEVRTLDEAVLVLRRSSGLRFDEDLGGYHLYGTDICLQAAQQGMRSYALSAFCIHNTNGYKMLPIEFWKRYFFLRKKWRYELPVLTPCTEITRWCASALYWNFERVINLALRRHRVGIRVAEPAALHRRLVDARTVAVTVCSSPTVQFSQ